jgi:hypothetical protein
VYRGRYGIVSHCAQLLSPALRALGHAVGSKRALTPGGAFGGFDEMTAAKELLVSIMLTLLPLLATTQPLAQETPSSASLTDMSIEELMSQKVTALRPT